MSRVATVSFAALFCAAVVGAFLLGTVAMGEQVPDVWIVAVGALGATVLLLVSDAPGRSGFSSLSWREVSLAVVGAGLLVGVAPWLVFSNRFTDAPPGSEVVFFTTAAWGMLGVLFSLVTVRERRGVSALPLGLLALLGAATVVANWERPSSFSPFVRYPLQEIWFVVAGVVWIAGTALLMEVRKRPAGRGAMVLGFGISALLTSAAAVAIEGTRGLGALAAAAPSAAGYAVGFGLLVLTWVTLARVHGPAKASALWFLAPALLTAYSVVEQTMSPKGPDPVVWPGALAGIALAVLAAAGLWSDRLPSEGPLVWPARWMMRAALIASCSAVLLGLLSLATPAFLGSVRGTTADGAAYSVAWELLGYESAGGWLPLVAGALLVAAVATDLNGTRMRRLLGGVIGVAALTAYPFLAATPLHTWNRWVPVEIQSEYGTEYAVIGFATIHDPLRVVAVALGVLSAVMLIVGAVRRRAPQTQQTEVVA